MEGIKEAKLSRGRKTNDEGIEGLLCDSGVSTGKRPEHGKAAAYQSQHNEPIHKNRNGAYESGGSELGQTFGGKSWRQLWRQTYN